MESRVRARSGRGGSGGGRPGDLLPLTHQYQLIYRERASCSNERIDVPQVRVSSRFSMDEPGTPIERNGAGACSEHGPNRIAKPPSTTGGVSYPLFPHRS
jgi:hypothetical protein